MATMVVVLVTAVEEGWTRMWESWWWRFGGGGRGGYGGYKEGENFGGGNNGGVGNFNSFRLIMDNSNQVMGS